MTTDQRIIYTARELDEPVTISHDAVLKALQDGEVDTEHGLMRFGSNYTFLVTVKHEGTDFLGIYKPRIGERPLWDFPDGTLCQRETASYILSELLGWNLVPPTVLREGPRGIGSIQVFIDHDPNRHYFTFDESMESQTRLMAAFDALANNADRKGGHCLLDADEHLWGIDHGLTFNSMYKLRTVIWKYSGEPFSEQVRQDMERLCQSLEDPDHALANDLRTLLAAYEFSALQNRLNRLLSDGTYPEPGPGPNRPWPAV
ncbi:MAG: SCO1664 family protein [Anaerolineae bacterium]|nr:SCO1664 family protein [Anaerolineae bacterium]